MKQKNKPKEQKSWELFWLNDANRSNFMKAKQAWKFHA